MHARHVKTVGEDNFYRQYEVAVQAFNKEGAGPLSPIAVIRSAMKSEWSRAGWGGVLWGSAG